VPPNGTEMQLDRQHPLSFIFSLVMVHERAAALLEVGIRGFSFHGRLEAENFPFCHSDEAEVVRYRRWETFNSLV